MEKTDIAWLAGIFDGEGCIWSRWPKRANVHVEIKMAHEATVRRINELFPGRFVLGNISAGALAKKPQWRWQLDTKKTKVFLELVLPYLFTKREEALIALKLCDQPDPAVRDVLASKLKEARA